MLLSYRQGLALIRAGLGLLFLSSAFGHLQRSWLVNPEPLRQSIDSYLQRGQTDAFYRPFLEGVVLPNALLFSQLIVLGELVVAASLILGLLTRVGAVISLWLLLNFMLMKGLANPAGSGDRLYLLLSLVCIFTATGLAWGLDAQLRDVFVTNPLTRWAAGLAGHPAQASRPRASAGGMRSSSSL